MDVWIIASCYPNSSGCRTAEQSCVLHCDHYVLMCKMRFSEVVKDQLEVGAISDPEINKQSLRSFSLLIFRSLWRDHMALQMFLGSQGLDHIVDP